MKIRLIFAIASALFLSASAFGHHGTQISYQLDKKITVSGTVTEWVFGFPHPSIFFDAKDENGKIAVCGLISVLKNMSA